MRDLLHHVNAAAQQILSLLLERRGQDTSISPPLERFLRWRRSGQSLPRLGKLIRGHSMECVAAMVLVLVLVSVSRLR